VFKDGKIDILLDSHHFMAGQRVSGYVTYLVDKPFPADNIVVNLTGK
jgi:hypothetical protein